MTATVTESWARSAAWFQANAAEELSLLQHEATPVEIDSAASSMGVELPQDFRTLYSIMNGCDPEEDPIGLFPSEDEWEDVAYGPLALGEIVSTWRMHQELLASGEFAGLLPEACDAEIVNSWWHPDWIPFAGNGGGDFLCIDLSPAENGTVGQVITHSHESGEHRLLARSLAQFLEQLAEQLEAGRYEYTEDGLQEVFEKED